MNAEPTTTVAGVGWYRPEQYSRLLRVADDADKLEETYEAWLRSAELVFQDGELAGMTMKKVEVDVEKLLAWCAVRGLAVDGAARARFVAEELRRQEQ